MNVLTISLPASSANIGPGFDSIGVALNRYLTLQVSQHEKWEFIHDSSYLPAIINDEHHFIYQVANRIAKKHNKILSPHQVIVQSDIPLARGLGSSASAILAGIELANQVCDLSLSSREKLTYGIDIEGHSDNITPALYGGFVITAKDHKQETNYIQLPPPHLDIVIYIPAVELKTSDARNILPETLSLSEAASASSISNLMIAALFAENYELAGEMMEMDLFHEPYRAELIPHYEMIRRESKNLGAFGTVISGAGPTLISFFPKNHGEAASKHMQTILPNYEVSTLDIDHHGLRTKGSTSYQPSS